MKNNFSIFPWSDNWWIENDEVWCVLGARNILCCFDLREKKCNLMIDIPNLTKLTFRATSYCMKYKNDIYCMPVCGKSIWVYSIENKSFFEIHIDNAPEEGLDIYDFWEYENEIFAVSIRLKKIIEINVNERKIENYYELCNEDSITRSVKVGKDIYSLSGTSERVYKFDLVRKGIVVYQLPKIERRFSTIAFDGKDFWMGGYHKEIYLWNKEKNTLDICSDFPPEFGMYSFEEDTESEIDYLANEFEIPAFLHSVAVGKYVWFIPFQTNKIVYADRESHKLYTFEIIEEDENKETLLERTELKTKYLLECTRGDRYIELYSTKSNKILEIDASQLTYRWHDCFWDDRSLNQYAILIDNVFYEQNTWDRNLYHRMLYSYSWQAGGIKQCNAGIEIYERIKKD